MSTYNTVNRGYTFPMKDEDLESSNSLLKILFERIDSDVQGLFDDKANKSEVNTPSEIDNKISNAIDGMDTTTYSGDVFTDPGDSSRLLITEVLATTGTFTKVTVNAKGQITYGTDLLVADISDFDDSSYLKTSDLDDSSTANNKLWSAEKINTKFGDYVLLTSYTDNDILSKIKNVDGSGSGLDADLLDGNEGTYFLNWDNFINKPTIITNDVTTIAAATEIDLDLNTNDNIHILLDMNIDDFLLDDYIEGKTGYIILEQDDTGNRLVTFGPSFLFPGGTTPTLSTAAYSVDKIKYTVFNDSLLCDFVADYK